MKTVRIATVLYAVWPGAPAKPVVTLSIGALKAVLIAFIFMKLITAPPLIRLAAVGASLWILLHFVRTFVDYLTRPWTLEVPVLKGYPLFIAGQSE